MLTPDETPGARSAVPGDRQVALRFVRLTRDFWRGETARCAWLWTLLLAAGVILTVFANVTVNRWNGWFFDALERKDGHSALVAMAVFPVIVLVVAGLGVLILKSRETFQVHWRRWLTAKLVDGWVGDRRFFRLGLSGKEPANPEYRIADDVRWATEPIVDFAMGLLSSVITIVIFIEILWEIGGSLRLSWGGTEMTIPAYLVLAAILYAVIVTLLVTAVGRRLAGLIAKRTESEAGLKQIEDLVNVLVDKKIGAIFVESSVSDRNVKALIEGAAAKGHEVVIGGELFSDAMGAPGTYEGTYIGMIDHNATIITRALGGEAPEKGLNDKLGS